MCNEPLYDVMTIMTMLQKSKDHWHYFFVFFLEFWVSIALALSLGCLKGDSAVSFVLSCLLLGPPLVGRVVDSGFFVVFVLDHWEYN